MEALRNGNNNKAMVQKIHFEPISRPYKPKYKNVKFFTLDDHLTSDNEIESISKFYNKLQINNIERPSPIPLVFVNDKSQFNFQNFKICLISKLTTPVSFDYSFIQSE